MNSMDTVNTGMPVDKIMTRMIMAIIAIAAIAAMRTKTTAKRVSILGIGSIRIFAPLRSKDIWKAKRPWK